MLQFSPGFRTRVASSPYKLHCLKSSSAHEGMHLFPEVLDVASKQGFSWNLSLVIRQYKTKVNIELK